MWILPKQLHTSAFVPATEALISDYAELSQLCAQSLTLRSKLMPARTWSQKANGDVTTMPLTAQVKAWATPATRDTQGPRGKGAQERKGNPMDTLPNQLETTSMRLNPRWVETLMGLPVGWTMVSCTRPIANPAHAAMMSSAGNAEGTTQTVHVLGQIVSMTDSRTDELRLLGNGVVPACAEKAFVTLFNQLHENTK